MEFREIRRYAGLGGIILAAVSTAYMLFDFNFKSLNPGNAVWMNILKFLLNITKIIICIYLMKRLMVKFRDDHANTTRQDVKKLGTLTAFLSALIFAAMTMVYLRLNPDFITGIIDDYVQANKSMMDSNTYTAIGLVEEKFPTIMFFSQLIYCFLFGWVLSAILAPRVVNDNPFINDGEDKIE